MTVYLTWQQTSLQFRFVWSQDLTQVMFHTWNNYPAMHTNVFCFLHLKYRELQSRECSDLWRLLVFWTTLCLVFSRGKLSQTFESIANSRDWHDKVCLYLKLSVPIQILPWSRIQIYIQKQHQKIYFRHKLPKGSLCTPTEIFAYFEFKQLILAPLWIWGLLVWAKGN